MDLQRQNSLLAKTSRKRGISLSIKQSSTESVQKIQNPMSSRKTSSHKYQLSQFTQRQCLKDDSLKKVIRYDSVININKKQQQLNESINETLTQRYQSSNYKKVLSQVKLNNEDIQNENKYLKIIQEKDKIIKQLQQNQRNQLNHICMIQQNLKKLQQKNFILELQNKQLKGIQVQRLPHQEEKFLTTKENVLKVVVKEECLKNIKNSRIKYLSNPIYQIQAKLNRILNQIKN